MDRPLRVTLEPGRVEGQDAGPRLTGITALVPTPRLGSPAHSSGVCAARFRPSLAGPITTPIPRPATISSQG